MKKMFCLLITLTLLSSCAFATGKLKILLTAGDHTVYIDKQAFDATGEKRLTFALIEGSHIVKITDKDDNTIYSKTVDITDGEIAILDAGTQTQQAKPKAEAIVVDTKAEQKETVTNKLSTKYYIEAVNHAATIDFNGGVGFDGGVLVPMSSNGYIDGSVSYYSGTNKVNMLSKGTLGFIGGNIGYLGIKGDQTSNFYYGAGIGYYTFTHDIDKTLLDALRAIDIGFQESVDASTAFYVKTGFKISAVDNIGFNVGIKYISLNPTVNYKLIDLTGTFPSLTGSNQVNLSHLILSVGLEF
jgi:hypothetical protein